MNINTNLCLLCFCSRKVYRPTMILKKKFFITNNQKVMSKLIGVGEYLGKIIAKSTSFGRYILQDTRVGKY